MTPPAGPVGTVDAGKVRVEQRGLLGRKRVTAKLERPGNAPERSHPTMPSLRKRAEGGDSRAKRELARMQRLIDFLEEGEDPPATEARAPVTTLEWHALAFDLAGLVEALQHLELGPRDRKALEAKADAYRRTLRANRAVAPQGFAEGKWELGMLRAGIGVKPLPQDIFDPDESGEIAGEPRRMRYAWLVITIAALSALLLVVALVR